MKTVCMIGEGAWGTAVATLLVHNGFAVNLWCHDAAVAKTIAQKRVNERYLPGILLDTAIKPMTSLEQALCGVQWVFEAIPVKFLRSVLQNVRSCFTPDQVMVILSKGIEQNTLLLPTQIIDDIYGTIRKAVFAGPSFAHEVAHKKITAVTVAATDCNVGNELQYMLATSYFRPYVTTDIIGVQVGAAVKNVIALGIGLLDGAGYTDNTKAFFMTRGLYEMVQLTHALGGKTETLYGLSGVGDLVLTSMGKSSRNVEVGRRLGAGEKLDVIIKQTGYTPEGVNTVIAVQQLGEKHALHMPLCFGIYNVIIGMATIHTVLEAIIHEPLEQECIVTKKA